jgi:hypothetical protein
MNLGLSETLTAAGAIKKKRAGSRGVAFPEIVPFHRHIVSLMPILDPQ